MPTTQTSLLNWTPAEWATVLTALGTLASVVIAAVVTGITTILRELRDLKTQHAATQADVAQIKQAFASTPPAFATGVLIQPSAPAASAQA